MTLIRQVVGRIWGGYLTSAPTVASGGSNRLDVFALGGDSALWHKWWDGTTWVHPPRPDGWESLGGFLTSAPTAASCGPNRLDVFALGGDKALWHKWWDGTAWVHPPRPDGWESLGGFLTSAPSVTSSGPNCLDVFALGGDNALWHKWWDGTTWVHPPRPDGWESLGSPPNVRLKNDCNLASSRGATLAVFAIGTDDQIYYIYLDNGWSNWGVAPSIVENGKVITPLHIAALGGYLYVHGSNGYLYSIYWALVA